MLLAQSRSRVPLAEAHESRKRVPMVIHTMFGPLSRGFCVAVDSPVCEPLVDVMDAYLTDLGYSGHGCMAQWLEQLTADQQVPGSIPAGDRFTS